MFRLLRKLRLQRIATAFDQWLVISSIAFIYKQRISIDFNKLWNLVPDQVLYRHTRYRRLIRKLSPEHRETA